MSNRSISTREIVMLLVLAVLLVGVGYYMFFYQPLQDELASLASQSAQLDNDINIAFQKASRLKDMEAELEEILSRPEDEITEIAPYDNAKIVMSQLNGILSASDNYSLSFQDPKIEENGTVRRYVSMTFDCPTYEDAKAIVQALSANRWRCLINTLSMDINENPVASAAVAMSQEAQQMAEAKAIARDVEKVLSGQGVYMGPNASEEEVVEEEEPYAGLLSSYVSVKATIVFFESTALTR